MTKNRGKKKPAPGDRPTKEDLLRLNPEEMFLGDAKKGILDGAKASVKARPGVYEQLFKR